MLPNFLICGAVKAGTTALHGHLKKHPDVLMSSPKETWFFSGENYEKGVEWFETHFSAYDGEHAIGEGTARMLATPEAPARIQELIPEARLIFSLRNPIERAYSHYHYHVYKGRQEANRSFREIVHDEDDPFRDLIIRHGMYDRHLARFEQHFDRSQMKIFTYDDFRDRQEEVVASVLDFIGVDSSLNVDPSQKRNVTRYSDAPTLYYWVRKTWHAVRNIIEPRFPGLVRVARAYTRDVLFSREKPSMHPEARAYLRELYAEPNARLEQRLNRDLSHWT